MILYVNKKNEVKDVNTTTDESLTPLLVTFLIVSIVLLESWPFEFKSVPSISTAINLYIISPNFFNDFY